MPIAACTTQALNAIYFETRSPCDDVAVWLTGTGRLDDVVISAGALDRGDHKQMAEPFQDFEKTKLCEATYAATIDE